MKIRVLLLAAGCSIGAFGAYAQKGVDNGTRFGSGEDSVRCITNISLFAPYAKGGNFKDAYEFWKIVYDECPAATKDIYLYGVRIVAWQIENEKDAAKRTDLINNLMTVYDKRVKYFGDDKRYGKDWIVARKVQDYYQYMGENSDNKTTYGWLKEIIDEYGDNSESLAVSLYAFASLKLMQADPNLKSQYIQDYLKSSDILDEQMKAATAANNSKDVEALTTYKSTMDAAFAGSGAADCETLKDIYTSKVEENKTNAEFLTEAVSLLRRSRCQEIEVYFAAAGYLHAIKPTAESAVGLGKQAVKKKDYETAINFFEEAANLESDPATKADDYYTIALLLSDQNNYSKSRQYCQKAIELNPNYGAAYMLIGRMYASTAKSIYPSDGVLARTVYYAALDKFEKARQVDPSIADEANGLINTFRAHLPSTEEIFMHPDLEKGKAITIGGWIGERTTIR